MAPLGAALPTADNWSPNTRARSTITAATSSRVAIDVEDTTGLDEVGDLSLKGLSRVVGVYNVVSQHLTAKPLGPTALSAEGPHRLKRRRNSRPALQRRGGMALCRPRIE